jgi:hypothetical protein
MEQQAKLVFLTFNEEEQADFMSALKEVVHRYDKEHQLPLDKVAEANITYRTPGDKRYFYCTIYIQAETALSAVAIVTEMLEKTKEEYAKLVEQEEKRA